MIKLKHLDLYCLLIAESEESEIGLGGEFAGEIDDREEEEIAAVQQVRLATNC